MSHISTIYYHMIKLEDIVKEIEQERIDEDWKKTLATAALGASMALGGGGVKGQTKAPVDTKPATTQTVTTPKAKTGTSVDGILGQFTSRFMFPRAYQLSKGNRVDLGFEANDALKTLTSFDTTKMNQWNAFVKWMKTHEMEGLGGGVISGNKALDSDSTLGTDAIEAYRSTPEGKNFWVKDGDDIKKVQKIIKAYRVYTMADWKAGVGKEKGKHGDIKLDRTMDPSNPSDVKRVEQEYMWWAKD